jgi:hypothetical protein
MVCSSFCSKISGKYSKKSNPEESVWDCFSDVAQNATMKGSSEKERCLNE